MKTSILTSLLVAAFSLSIAAAAEAADYTADFTISDGHSGTLTLTTPGDASLGLTLVTNITGTVNGDPIAIVAPGGLSLVPTNDNLFTTTNPFFDFGGIGFQDTFTGGLFNIYANDNSIYGCLQDGPICNSTATFTLESGVPEPATWAMMLVGFGAMGVAMRRRRSHAAAMT